MRKKLIQIFAGVLVSCSTLIAFEQKSQFAFYVESEKELGAAFVKKYGHERGLRIERDGYVIRGFYPNIRGGGAGVKDVIIYSGNDIDGWQFAFWGRTMETEIDGKMNGEMLEFRGTDKKLLFSISINLLSIKVGQTK